MTTKYSIDLRQFNNGEVDTISFPTFDQCLMYGLHKLKKSFEAGRAIVQAITIKDKHGRKIIVTPSEGELDSLHSFHHGRANNTIIIKKDSTGGDNTILF